jgi:hypothetical protein
MKVSLALLADAANVSREGKLNILGVFDRIHAKSFPVVHAQMKLVIRLEASPAEIGSKHNVEIKLLSENGEAVLGIKGQVELRGAPPGHPLRMDQVVSMNNVRFKTPGHYEFAILIDNDQKATVPLVVSEIRGKGLEVESDEGMSGGELLH